MKRAQSEMVGFALIVVIVSIVVLIFLISTTNNSKSGGEVTSSQTDSFLNSVLQYTTNCTKRGEFLTVRKLVDECQNDFICENQKNSCSVLNETLKPIIENSWDLSSGSLVKGYEFVILINNKTVYKNEAGNITQILRGSKQEYDSDTKQIFFTVYY